jgi:CheY-like chemotaxis protein
MIIYMEAQKNTVVVIDDDYMIIKLINIFLSKAGLQVKPFISGLDACLWLSENKPSIIISDILMPDVDGIAILGYVRKTDHLKNIPVLAITALVMTGYKEKFLSKGFNAYFPKPINMMNLIKEVCGLIELNQKTPNNAKQEAKPPVDISGIRSKR